MSLKIDGWSKMSQPFKEAPFSAAEEAFLKQLTALPLDSINDGKAGQEKCIEIGREIINQFKITTNGDNLEMGRQELRKISAELRLRGKDGEKRQRYVEHAWEGILCDNHEVT